MTEVARVKNNTKPKPYKQAHVRRQRKELSSKPVNLILPNVTNIVRYCCICIGLSKYPTDDTIVAGLVLAVLLTGRKLPSLVSHQLVYEITPDGCGRIGSSWVFPTPKLPSFWKKKLYQPNGFHGLVLPHFIATILQHARDLGKSIKLWEIEINTFLGKIPRFIEQTLSVTRLCGVLSQLRREFDIDRFELDFITDREIEHNSQHHYVIFEISSILEKHFRYMNYILGFAPQPQLLLIPEIKSALFGSQLALTDDGVKEVFSNFEYKIKHYYQQHREREKLHNWYTIYVVQVLQLATLHRPKNGMFGSLIEFSTQFDTVMIIDKGESSARRVPIPLTARNVFKGYLDYLQALLPLVQFSYPEIKNKLLAILSGEASIFHLWHRDQLILLNTKFIENLLSECIPLHLNWHRHTVATALVQKGTERAYLAAFMGHDLPLDKAFSKHSALDYQGMLTICGEIEAQLKKWQIPALKVVPD